MLRSGEEFLHASDEVGPERCQAGLPIHVPQALQLVSIHRFTSFPTLCLDANISLYDIDSALSLV